MSMTRHPVAAGCRCDRCHVIAWGGEAWYVGRLGTACPSCWEMWPETQKAPRAGLGGEKPARGIARRVGGRGRPGANRSHGRSDSRTPPTNAATTRMSTIVDVS